MRRSFVHFLVAMLASLAVGILDWATGTELRVHPLYFLPMSLGAWYGGRRGAALLACWSAAIWGVSNSLAGLEFSRPSLWAGNAFAQFLGFVTVGLLIAELRVRLEAERSLSRVDALTGLANRRALHEQADLVLALARRHARPTTLVYIDLDNFKAVNDSQGHAAGDELLRTVADRLRASVRVSDIVARLGGDELALLLPETDRAAATQVVERFRAELSEAMAAAGWPVTASIGVVTIAEAPAEVDQAFARVDALMYRAKQGGKDRVVFEEDPSG